MFICHKLLVSNEVAVLQACPMSDVYATLAVPIMPASWELVCQWAPHTVLSTTSGFSNTIARQRCITTTAATRRSCRTHENFNENTMWIQYIFDMQWIKNIPTVCSQMISQIYYSILFRVLFILCAGIFVNVDIQV